jgi:hypothetical protein
MIIRGKKCGKEIPLDIFQNIFSDEFKTVMSNFKTPMSRRSYKKFRKINSYLSLESQKITELKWLNFILLNRNVQNTVIQNSK